MQAHIISGVVMDIAAFKVSHSTGPDIDGPDIGGPDIDAAALRAARARSSSIGAMEETSRHTCFALLEYTLVLVSVAVPMM